MPVRPRRRKPKRHVLHPLRYATPEVLASVTKIVALVAAAAAPSAIVSQQNAHKAETAVAVADTTRTQLSYANANTNAVLGIVAILATQLDSLRTEVAALRRESYRAAVRLPESMIGPEVPAGWIPQPPKKRKFLGLFG